MTSDYTPIGCDQHSVLELLAMRRAVVRMQAADAHGRPLELAGRVIDVRTRDSAEYLVLREHAGIEHAVRLDRVRALFDGEQKLLWRQTIDSP